MVRVGDVDEGLCPECLEVGNVGLVPTPCFFWHYIIQGTHRGYVVDVGGISECVIPVALREVYIDEHGPDLVKESPVHALAPRN